MKTIDDTAKKIIERTIQKEGGYTNDPEDSGGETNFGITKKVALEWGYWSDMKDMSVDVAISIYHEDYWNKIWGAKLIKLSPTITEKLFNIGVNAGVSVAIKILQRALNAIPNATNDSDNVQLDEDGILGSKTIFKFTSHISYRSDLVLYTAINALLCMHYIELAEKRPKNRNFIYGWIRNRVI